jgi:hypothetical protein
MSAIPVYTSDDAWCKIIDGKTRMTLLKNLGQRDMV